jgi:SpoVK/Ycf46/Vps4 family AAA+-type ATPase
MVPLNCEEEIHPEHYPFLSRMPSEQIEAFLASDCNVMLLIGPPGTGKSTYLRAMLDSMGDRRVTTMDSQDVLMHPGLGGLIRSSAHNTVFIAEDADAFVGKRENGNPQMSMLLNLADGIIKSERKFIISTNLPSLANVDPALIRPGRCFDILEFRKLDNAEANAVRALTNPDLPVFTEDRLTLAEVLNYESPSEIHRRTATGAGLIATR